MSSHLIGGRLNVSLVQEALRKELLNLLQKYEGPKVTIWDEWLTGPVGLVAEYSLIKENEVVDMCPLKRGRLPATDVKHFIFIARPKIELMDIIADYILKSKHKTAVQFHLFMVPSKSELCEKYLSNKGVLGSISIDEYRCNIVPFESDLMSMELQNDFREYFLEGDPTCLFYAAHALKTLQDMFGIFPRILGKGQAAKHVYDVFTRINKEEENLDERLSSLSPVDQVLILDRTVDLTAVFTTQLSYEGLVDELFGVKNATVTFPGQKFLPADDIALNVTAPEKKRIILNSSDELYREIRDKNFSAVGAALSKKARIIKSEMDERHKEKTVQELKHFVSRLQQLLASKQSLAMHTTIAEFVKEVTDTFDFHDLLEFEEEMLHCIDNDKQCPFIEDLIAQKATLVKVLRLICLQCSTGSGLKQKVLDYYKKEIVQVYGLKAWLTLCNLEQCGLLNQQINARPYTVLKKSLQLTEDSNSNSPSFGYLNTKYTPVTIRLAEHISKNKGWSGISDVIGSIPGPMFDEMHSTHNGSRSNIVGRRNSLSSESSSVENSRTVLVFFLGGCTYNEISALRSISNAEDSNVEFVILTTKLINGNTLLQSLMEE